MPSPDPFAPGAMPFQGIPQRTLPEDCMEYILFAISATLNSPPLLQQRLAEIQTAASVLLRQHADGYIWQRESFNLRLRQLGEEEGDVWCLEGKTEYGDAVDDEWFIVWMLRELSKQFPELWIRVYDTDGEFLLIEAANVLPRWLNPEIASNRVWINAGRLYIIPLSSISTPLSKAVPTSSRCLTLPEALSTISTCHRDSLTRIRLVEEEAFFRIISYPDAVLNHLHHALVQLPRRIVGVLHKLPSSVAAATETFYLRDPISLKSLKSLEWEDKDTVTVSVKFTKVLYAQLRGQAWEPPFTKVKEGDTKKDVGVKLAAGLHMLLADAGSPVAGSPVRKDLIQNIRSTLNEESPPTDKEISSWEKKVDSDEWLEIDFTAFEADLAGKNTNTSKNAPSGWGDKAAEDNLKKMVERFESFLNDDAAGLEGAEFGDEMDEDEDSEEDEDSDLDSDGEDKEVSFDENEFARMMREMMGLPAEGGVAEKGKGIVEELEGKRDGEDEGEDAEKELREIAWIQQQIEAELKAAGALEQTSEREREKSRIKEVNDDEDKGEEEVEEEGPIDVDYNLAKNLLESFKGQGGLAGPGGNLLARMGITLPRDEGEEEDRREKA